MRIGLIITAVGFIVLCGWKTQQKNEIKKAEWLIGTWENHTPKGSIYETWTKINDDEFSGKSYVVKEKDTIVFEIIKIVQEKDGLFYIPTVKNQNNSLPVRFTLKNISDTSLIFENPHHDFPQIISYTSINTDSLVAEISGMKNGQQRTQTFPMKRVSICETDNKNIVEGDLYFKLIDFTRFFDGTDSTLTKIETSVRTMNKDTLSEQDKIFYDVVQFMIDKKLFRKPYIRLRQNNGKIIMVFLDAADFEKMRDYNQDDLIRDNKKIRIKAEVSELRYDSVIVYETLKLISVDKIDGKTYWKK